MLTILHNNICSDKYSTNTHTFKHSAAISSPTPIPWNRFPCKYNNCTALFSVAGLSSNWKHWCTTCLRNSGPLQWSWQNFVFFESPSWLSQLFFKQDLDLPQYYGRSGAQTYNFPLYSEPFLQFPPHLMMACTCCCQHTHVWGPEELESHCGEGNHSKQDAQKKIVSKLWGDWWMMVLIAGWQIFLCICPCMSVRRVVWIRL